MSPGCGYSCNLSAIAEIAMSDERINKILKEGGVVHCIGVWGPPHRSKELTNDPCWQLYYTFIINYKGGAIESFINESARNVDTIIGLKETPEK